MYWKLWLLPVISLLTVTALLSISQHLIGDDWRLRGKISRSVLRCIVYKSCAQLHSQKCEQL